MDSNKLQALLDSWLGFDDLNSGYAKVLVQYKLNPSTDTPKIMDAITQDLTSRTPKLKISEDNLVRLWNYSRNFRTQEIRNKIPESKQTLLKAAVELPILSHILNETPVGIDILAMLEKE